MMTNVKQKETYHNYLDDIKFQSVIANRRNSFVSNDYQIVARNAQNIKDIEKSQRIATADHKRQENAYLQKLEKLRQSKEKLNSDSSPSQHKGERRHSAPTVYWGKLSRQTTQDSSLLLSRANSIFPQPSTDGPQTASSSSSQTPRDSQKDAENNNCGSPPQNMNMLARMAYRPTAEARRLSYDLQQETNRNALQKLDSIVRNQRRRATISEGLQSDFSSLIRSKTANINRTDSIEEEDGVFG